MKPLAGIARYCGAPFPALHVETEMADPKDPNAPNPADSPEEAERKRQERERIERENASGQQ